MLEIIRKLRVLDGILKISYGTPSLGNVGDPVDEAIYLMIAQRTKLETAHRVFLNLKAAASTWDEFLENPESFAEILSEGGRGKSRSKNIGRFLKRVKKRFGKASLEKLREMKEEEVIQELVDELKLGEKTAYCVMIYSLGFNVFPVDANIIRIFKRMGIAKELLGNISKMDHRVLQRKIAKLVPPEIGASLHVNLVVHGRLICIKTPKCSTCPISGFCEYYRNQNGPQKTGPVVIDLFAGPGGLSLGFKEAGWRIAYAVEDDIASIKTYEFNHIGTQVIKKDVRTITDGEIQDILGSESVDIILAGVPCQGFSLASSLVRHDLKKRSAGRNDKNTLYEEVFRFVDELEPKIVLFENVPGMSKGRVSYNDKSSPIVDVLNSEFRSRGYHVKKMVLDAADYGIPQKRKRLFVIGSRVCNPEEIYNRIIEKKIDSCDYVTLKATIEELPKLSENDGLPISGLNQLAHVSEAESTWGPSHPRVVLYGHFTRPHNSEDMEIIRALNQGMTYGELFQNRKDIFERRRKAGREVYDATNFRDKFYRLKEAQPSRTIVSHLAKDGNSFIHPTQNRSLTPREAARVQTFPDSYIFFGSRGAQFRQIGNAVPPKLASILATAIRECLDSQNEHGEGESCTS
jgi:DNA (cytosine-5)-methyltransferase 1